MAGRRLGGRGRWLVCGLLFAATAINYVDRQMIGVLKAPLQRDLGWSEAQYADIVFWFQAAYAAGFLFMGRLIDRVGARLGYTLAFAFWTAAHMAHGLASSAPQFAAARFGLGLGESGNFPAALKAIGEWFPQRDRAFAVGLVNAGANVGAIVTPLLVPALTLAYGWRVAFFATGLFGVAWLGAWIAFYRKPPHAPADGAGPAEPQDPVERIAWRRLLTVRETWAYALPKFLTDPIWWLYLFWLPDLLGRRYGLDLKGFGLPLVAIYLMSDAGSIVGGWTSSRLLRAGWSANRARKVTMLGCALCVLPIVAVQHVTQLWPAVLLIGLATAGHQAFSANLLTIPSDLFPRQAVGSVVGIGGAAGAIGGMLIAKLAGQVLGTEAGFSILFVLAAAAYFAALAMLHLASPRLTPSPNRSVESLR